MGQEAEISVSLPLNEVHYEKDYESDPLVLDMLASLAVCTGFEFVKKNIASQSISVALPKCFDSHNELVSSKSINSYYQFCIFCQT